jgi:HEAT repeat protein
MLFASKPKQVESAIAHKKADKLISLAKDKDKNVAISAIRGLGTVGGEDAVNFLVTQLRHITPEYRAAAATSLGEIGDPHAKAHISGVLKFEKDADTINAMHAAMARLADY